jgi:hypothetical protein
MVTCPLADLDDSLGGSAFESAGADANLRFAGVAISLALDDASAEHDVFK